MSIYRTTKQCEAQVCGDTLSQKNSCLSLLGELLFNTKEFAT
jgi:hypothetical protein